MLGSRTRGQIGAQIQTSTAIASQQTLQAPLPHWMDTGCAWITAIPAPGETLLLLLLLLLSLPRQPLPVLCAAAASKKPGVDACD